MAGLDPKLFNKQWLKGLSAPLPLSSELVTGLLAQLQSGREAYLISVLLSLDDEIAERIVSTFNALSPYDRDELAEVMGDYLQKKNEERPIRVLTPWGSA